MEIIDIEGPTTHVNGQLEDNTTTSDVILKKTNRPVTLKFEDVVYKTKTMNKQGISFLKSKKQKAESEKMILKGVTGMVCPGEILAMLGPSGSGKTTLLTALGGRLGGHVTGTITYNGKPFSNSMKRNTGFVSQDDVLYPHLTVTETLVFTALLRLPRTLTKQEKAAQAEAVIAQLGLTKCKNSIIGGQFLRGISGGEKRRVSIGQEMLINPSLLFLDEPTSGLDSTTAQRIVSTLRELSIGGRTIVMTIHQPSSRLFYLFNKVLLLCEGNPLYFGKGSDVMTYFASIGFSPSVAMNPADFLLDLANGIGSDDTQGDKAEVKESLVYAYKTNLLETVKKEMNEISEDDVAMSSVDKKQYKGWSVSWWEQFTVLLRRGLKQRRHESFSGLKLIQVFVLSLLTGSLWWRSHDLQDQIGLLFFYSSFWAFFPLFQAIFTFPAERTMLQKERSSGMYQLSSFFMARTVGDLPMELVLPTTFMLITYWMAGLKPTPTNFFSTLSLLLLCVLVCQSLGLAIGALIMDQKSATTFGSVVMLSFLLVSGFYVRHVPTFISWIKYLSIGQYTFKLLIESQYRPDERYPCSTGGVCFVREHPTIMKVELGKHVTISVVALFIMLLGYRLLAYVALMRVGRTK